MSLRVSLELNRKSPDSAIRVEFASPLFCMLSRIHLTRREIPPLSLPPQLGHGVTFPHILPVYIRVTVFSDAADVNGKHNSIAAIRANK
jgi:hypothetical protein